MRPETNRGSLQAIRGTAATRLQKSATCGGFRLQALPGMWQLCLLAVPLLACLTALLCGSFVSWLCLCLHVSQHLCPTGLLDAP